jgi:lysophospholipase L1-like esterase
MGDFVIKDGDTIVFAGDSITDCGRRAESAPYGAGYVKATISLITARYPERRINYVNAGIGGNTVEDLRNRWHDDVLFYQPNWVTILIGINDLHRCLGDGATAVPPDKFERLYRELLEMTAAQGKASCVLLDPFYISTDTESDSHRSRVLHMLGDYLAIVAKLAKQFDCRHVMLHHIFQEQLRHRPAEFFCPEPVHPALTGHLVIAHALLNALNW